MAAIINQAPRECRAARIKAGGRKEFIYPEDVYKRQEQLTAEKPSGGESDNTTPLEEVKSETAEPHQETPPEPPQKAEAPEMGADTQQAVESHTGSPEGVEMPSDGPAAGEDTSEQEKEIPEAPSIDLEQSSQPEAESHEGSTPATESEPNETAPPEPKEEKAEVVPPSESHEEPAAQELSLIHI